MADNELTTQYWQGLQQFLREILLKEPYVSMNILQAFPELFQHTCPDSVTIAKDLQKLSRLTAGNVAFPLAGSQNLRNSNG